MRRHILIWLGLCLAVRAQNIPKFPLSPGPLVLGGAATPWRFIDALGEQSGIWGFENGRLEGWVYPLKLFRDFHLAFQLESSPAIHPGDEIVRSVHVYPHMVQLRYVAEQFAVTETLFAPRQERGFVILLDIEAPAAMRVYVRFRPQLDLMWPGSIGGQTFRWVPDRKWIELGEPSGRFSAFIGSPAAVGSTAVGYHAYLTDERPHEAIELAVSPETAKRFFVPVVVSTSAATYQELLTDLPRLYASSLEHYVALDTGGTQFLTPDPEVNESLRWARLSLDRLKVCNPQLGCSYVAGIGPSGTGTRPMYAWFFQDVIATAPAYLEYGGAESMKEAFRFAQKYQRADGKIAHEVSQSAGFINWFKDYPYAYIHTSSSFGYLVAMANFYRFTGDEAFLKESWPSIRKAYEYSLTVVDPEDGLIQIPPTDWDSSEKYGTAKESDMGGEWIMAVRAMRDLSLAMGEAGLAAECARRDRQASESMERFWNPEQQYYNFGWERNGKPLNSFTTGMARLALEGVVPANRVPAILGRLNTASWLSDWGQRGMSFEDPRYVEGSYGLGSAWPVQTMGPMLANFRFHNAVQGFQTWMSIMHVRTLNARGAMPEAMSGTTYRQLDNGVPHQQFSELATIPGLVEGVLGLEMNVPRQAFALHPHLPPSWPHASLKNFPYGTDTLDLTLRRDATSIRAVLEFSGNRPVSLDFSPALPAGSQVISVSQDGKPIKYEVEDFASDVHVRVLTKVQRQTELEIHYRPGIAIEAVFQPVLEGETSQNLRVLGTAYKDAEVQMVVEGRPERTYELLLYTPWRPKLTGSMKILHRVNDRTVLALVAPPEAADHLDRAGYARWTVRIAFDK